ncbi:LOW QUALITY PROTEIN: aldehyde dehydrogenase family 16 member A1 [Strigops habroptila]|uniref:LOW QUALITY PROTEIN: aldehyde dehydrogenase family 16 member A1 n=1 Tax=Strigops habroptila TaxID=2489341 RepID=UPI0011CFFA71|nr:LOW QUALITY PROTEIN: aldehyde dehydrogenase family 16 member A1 [Strigops habroptila]
MAWGGGHGGFRSTAAGRSVPLPRLCGSAVAALSGPEVTSVVAAAAMAALGPPPVPEIFETMEEGPERGGAAGEAWLQAQGRALGHFVAGTWLKPPGRERLQGWDAATGRALCSVLGGDVGDVAAAVAAAKAAPWGGLGGAQRGDSLERCPPIDPIAPYCPPLPSLMPLPPTAPGWRGRCRGGPALWGLWPRWARGRIGPEAAARSWGGALRALREAAAGARGGPPGLRGWSPLGVVAVVVAGPCPLGALMGTLGPLLAMGNGAVVLVLVPPGGGAAALLPLLVAELGGAGGGAPLPPGVLNVVTGTPPLHRALRDLPGLSAVTLLGDTEDPPLGLWGRRYLRGGPRGGPVVVIVLDSADLDSAATAIAGGGGRAPPVPDLGGAGGAGAPPGAAASGPAGGAVGRGPPEPPRVGRGHRVFLVFLISMPRLLPVRSVPEVLSVLSGLPPPAAASLWAQDLPLALDTAQRLPMGLVWINALEVPQPWGGASAMEMLRLFGRPPWAPPAPPLDEPISPGGPEVTLDPDDVAAAVGVARRVAAGWARLEAATRARVLQGALEALRGGAGGDEELLQGALLRWAARALLAGGAVKEAPGGRFLVTRRPLGVVGVAWSGPRPLRRALELLPPALAFGNALVLVAPPGGLEAARRLQKALEAAGLPGGALAVLPGGAAGSGVLLARQRLDGLWLCGGDTDLDWGSIGGDPQVWVPGGGILAAPPHDADVELELRSTRPHSLWLPLTPDL